MGDYSNCCVTYVWVDSVVDGINRVDADLKMMIWNVL
jgi:hypothetical protein